MKIKSIVSSLFLLCSTTVLARKDVDSAAAPLFDEAVWQWGVTVEGITSPETKKPPKAWLWVPPKARRINGVVIGQFNMLERPIMENARFRSWMEKIGFACVWVAPTLTGPRFDVGDAEKALAIEATLKALSDASGYEEIAKAPLIGLGHSAMAAFPYELAANFGSKRVLCGISFDGNTPGVTWGGSYEPEKSEMNEETISRIGSVPFLLRDGEYSGGRTNRRPEVLKKVHPEIVIDLFADPGSGHFGWTDEGCNILGEYITAVYSGRLDKFRAKLPSYREKCRDMAKKVPLLGYYQNGELLPDRRTHPQIHPKFVPDADGVTFHIEPGFIDYVTEGRAPGWTGKKAGELSTHPGAEEAMRIYFKKICGPVDVIDRTTFRIRFDRFGFDETTYRSHDIYLLAVYPGNDKYKRVELQSNMRIPLFNKKGTAQKIEWTQPLKSKGAKKRIVLDAIATSGLPVSYCVNYGPAHLEGNTLVVDEIPVRAKRPIRISVTAQQYGVKDKVQSAVPIERTFNL